MGKPSENQQPLRGIANPGRRGVPGAHENQRDLQTRASNGRQTAHAQHALDQDNERQSADAAAEEWKENHGDARNAGVWRREGRPKKTEDADTNHFVERKTDCCVEEKTTAYPVERKTMENEEEDCQEIPLRQIRG